MNGRSSCCSVGHLSPAEVWLEHWFECSQINGDISRCLSGVSFVGPAGGKTAHKETAEVPAEVSAEVPAEVPSEVSAEVPVRGCAYGC